jgi:hypothetical protein
MYKMELDKIIDVFSINHDGTIVNIRKEKNDLNIDIDIQYLAQYFEKSFTIMKYKIKDFLKLEFIDCDNNKYENISEINKMELNIYEAELGEDGNIIINVWSDKIPYGKLFLWGNDIKIYDQNNSEIEYNKLIEICENYWDNFSNNIVIK